MRITTTTAYESSIANLQRRQQSLSEAQQQLTSGKRVQKASDDPAAAAIAERALAAMTRSESHQRALDAAKAATQLGESALGDAADILQQVRETVVSAGNGTYGDADRLSLADKMRSLRGELLAVANRQDSNQHYLFGGQGNDTQPITETTSGVVYNVSSGTGYDVAAMARRMLALAGVSAVLGSDPALVRAVDVPVLVGDSSRLRSATGWSPAKSLDDLLADVLDASP